MTYENYQDPETGLKQIKKFNDDGSVSIFPADESNADYKAYLKRDEAETK